MQNQKLETCMTMIRIEATKCHRMMRKPQNCDIEDLIQEGVLVFFRAYQQFLAKPRSVTFKLYFHRALINQLNEMLILSYKEPVTDGEIHNRPARPTATNLIQRILCDHHKLSETARRYLILCINPPAELRQKLITNRRAKFWGVREHLRIDYNDERKIRKEIRGLLKE